MCFEETGWYLDEVAGGGKFGMAKKGGVLESFCVAEDDDVASLKPSSGEGIWGSSEAGGSGSEGRGATVEVEAGCVEEVPVLEPVTEVADALRV